ncbi:class I SAM-dependent methyltransferase [Streptomyces boluensis]|uniref:Methyltransferase domain-containing protein n=1 Tax=Streptomyces boluensis TaxID=1775135 RepID=A0A964XMZ1_9ACTN|nr:class I SAM-dependent methyltransferase [Streptomyces boluensis]NBE53242.1 methyltransferase domain-containing protein [Streptomyces boluensis]
MPTVPSGRSGRPSYDSDQIRRTARSFGTDAARYDRTRPRYPQALVDRLAAAARPAPSVLDVGCGTGIVARQFRAAGCHVLGVDVDPRMAELARRDGTEVEVAAFETWDAAGRTFDAVVSGQTWHWLDPEAAAAASARALRPGGRLAAFWNVPTMPPELVRALVAVYQRVAPDSPFALGERAEDAYDEILTRAEDGIRATGAFGAPQRWRDDWKHTYTRDAWLDQMRTHGALTLLAPEHVAEVLAEVGAAIDALGGTFAMPYTTVTVTAVRTG